MTTIDDDYSISMIINDINWSYCFLMTNNGSQCFFIILMDLTAITGSFKRNLLTYVNGSLPY
jgi:hypothetical protein